MLSIKEKLYVPFVMGKRVDDVSRRIYVVS